MKKNLVLVVVLISLTVLTSLAQKKPAAKVPFSVVEATIPDMQKALKEGRVTSHELVAQYLMRIGMYNQKLRAAITVNPQALAQADQLDRERAQGRLRGPLHGIPVGLKDNILTTSLPTSGGTIAFEGYVPPYAATLTKNLEESGAIIIAKTGMSELANWMATGLPGNYNALGGQGFNPYDPRKDPRDATFDGRPVLGTGGSSSGVGTAANLWAANVGTETSGSILSPSNQNMLAAIKPTVGRISRWGIIPVTLDQDTAGPMAKSVSDVAIMFGVLESAKPDPNDVATQRCVPPPNRDYTPFLKADGLKGARIGIPRANYYSAFTVPGTTQPRGGLDVDQAKAMADAIDVLKKQGAIIVDPVEIPSVAEKDPKKNLLSWDICRSQGTGEDENCSIVFQYGMKRDFDKWLSSLGSSAPFKTLTELRAWNKAHEKAGTIKYGQATLDSSDARDLAKDKARYEADRAKDILLGGTTGIDAVMKANNLDALFFPGASGAAIAAKPGYPTVLVPFAMVPNNPNPPLPAGFNAKPQPFGVGFTGMACSEPKLLTFGYAFEQATRKRQPPPSAP